MLQQQPAAVADCGNQEPLPGCAVRLSSCGYICSVTCDAWQSFSKRVDMLNNIKQPAAA
jgi:hypothetical protein